MGGIYVLVLIFTAVGAVLSVPVFYLWAWAAGGAVKYLGRKWEEGRQQTVRSISDYVNAEYLRGVDDGQADRARRITHPAPGVQESQSTALPAPQKYTITGRQIR